VGAATWRFRNEQDQWVEKTALAMPHFCPGKLVGIKFKTIDGTKQFSQMPGSSTDALYAIEHLCPEASDVLILEGPEDAALAISHGFNAVAINAADAGVAASDTAALCRHSRIFLIGDQDPSGRTIEADLEVRIKKYGCEFTLERLAIFAEDIREFNLPPLRVKMTDSRAKEFLTKYRNACVELDALPPIELRNRIRSSVEQLLDNELWNRAVEVEQVELANIRDAVARWPKSKWDSDYQSREIEK
jgi:hypothetical protein